MALMRNGKVLLVNSNCASRFRSKTQSAQLQLIELISNFCGILSCVFFFLEKYDYNTKLAISPQKHHLTFRFGKVTISMYLPAGSKKIEILVVLIAFNLLDRKRSGKFIPRLFTSISFYPFVNPNSRVSLFIPFYLSLSIILISTYICYYLFLSL